MQLQYARSAPAQNVSTRRNSPRPETRPRRDVSTSRDRLETETSLLRLSVLRISQFCHFNFDVLYRYHASRSRAAAWADIVRGREGLNKESQAER